MRDSGWIGVGGRLVCVEPPGALENNVLCVRGLEAFVPRLSCGSDPEAKDKPALSKSGWYGLQALGNQLQDCIKKENKRLN